MVIEQLLGSVPKLLFMEEYFLKLPFARTGSSPAWTELGTWKRVELLLAQPGVDVLVGQEGQRWDGSGPPTPAEARGLLENGYTIGIRHAERHDPELAELAAGFEHDFRAPIDIHLYCTLAGQRGLGWHYDAEDVFVLQTQGSKEWLLRKNTVNPWPLIETIPADMRYERELMPVLRCRLAAGDWLYIPADKAGPSHGRKRPAPRLGSRRHIRPGLCAVNDRQCLPFREAAGTGSVVGAD